METEKILQELFDNIENIADNIAVPIIDFEFDVNCNFDTTGDATNCN